MPDPASLVTPVTPDRTRSWRRAAVWLFGALLLAGAIFAILRSGDDLQKARAALSLAPVWMLAAMLAAPLANLAVVSMSFWFMLSRAAPVGRVEMAMLIGAAWLLNQLPLRPGLVGRLAYHKAINGIPLRTSIRISIEVALCGVSAVAIMLVSVLAAGRWPAFQSGPIVAATAPFPVLILLAISLRGASARQPADAPRHHAWRWASCLALRYADVLIWVGRYALVFAAVGRPISMADAVIIGAVSQAAMLLPVQLGVREWAVGLAASLLTTQARAGIDALAPGLLADVITRAAEIAVAIPTGLIAAAWVRRRLNVALVSKPNCTANV